MLIGQNYRLVKKIGEGSFGKIFLCTACANACAAGACANACAAGACACACAAGACTNGKQYAIKILATRHAPYLENEVTIYQQLKGIKNIPSLYASGEEAGKYSYLVIDLLGQSVEQLRAEYGKQMSLKIVLHLSLQMLNVVEQIHDRGIVHRDLKPANFLLKTNEKNISEIYLIDFGLARSFLDGKGRHVTLNANETLVGTQRYMSINTHHGLTASRRDDLETLGYIMLFLADGELPWQGQKSLTEVAALKQGLTWTMNRVGEFVLFILAARNLGFADKPNYVYLRNVLTNLYDM
jgi:serine/threonine protein kinase